MQLHDLLTRQSPPAAWAEGDNIPWNEPAFSARMLKEHLTQEHDMASRRTPTIERHVAWIHSHLLGERPSRVLDMGCGPGLYTNRLARLGHTCLGIDFSPASIDYARQTAAGQGLSTRFVLDDLRHTDYGQSQFDLAMLIFGELNIFRPAHVRQILRKAQAALALGGLLLLEPHTYAAVERMGQSPPAWYTAQRGLFSDGPYLFLEENFWDAGQEQATTRMWVIPIDAQGETRDGNVTRLAQSFQAYTEEGYRSLLHECGFTQVEFYPGLAETQPDPDSSLLAITAVRG